MKRHPSPTWTPERTASQIALFRNVIAGAGQLGLTLSMPIQAANDFARRAHLSSWPDMKDALNTDIHWDLPGDVRFTPRRRITLPAISTP